MENRLHTLFNSSLDNGKNDGCHNMHNDNVNSKHTASIADDRLILQIKVIMKHPSKIALFIHCARDGSWLHSNGSP